MPINFFQISDDSNEEKPFVEDFAKASPRNCDYPYEVKEVRLTKKRTGYLLVTYKFLVFIFKNKPLCKELIKALELYQKNGNGYALYVQPMQVSPYFQIGFDADEERYWLLEDEGKYLSQGLDTIVSLEVETESTLIIPPPPTQTATGRKTTTHRNSKKPTNES